MYLDEMKDPVRAKSVATFVWNVCFRESKTVQDSLVLVAAMVLETGFTNPELLSGESKRYLQHRTRMDLTWAGLWAHHAFPTMQTSHSFAMALMLTDTSRSITEDLALPWPAFVVKVPGGLLVYESAEGECEIREIRVARWETLDGREQATMTVTSSRGTTTVDGDLRWILFREQDAAHPVDGYETFADRGPDSAPLTNSEARAMSLIRKLLCGLLIAFENGHVTSDKTYSAKRRIRECDSPDHRVVTIGRPVRLGARDLRASIDAFVSGRRAKPATIQSVVRGHYKMQAHGPLRASRMRIWVEPYWRGPEDAPILARPHILTNSSVEGAAE